MSCAKTVVIKTSGITQQIVSRIGKATSNVLRNVRLWGIEAVMRGQRHHRDALPLAPGTLRYPRDFRPARLMRRNKPRPMNDLTFVPAKVVFYSGRLA
jgi:hypothetical protein